MSEQFPVLLALLMSAAAALAPSVTQAQDSATVGFTPDFSVAFGPRFTSAALSAGTDDTRAEVQTSFLAGRFDLDLSASAPLSGSGSTQIASLNGLSTGTTVSLALSNMTWKFGGYEYAVRECQRLLEAGELRKEDGAAIDPDDTLTLDGDEMTWASVCESPGGTLRFNLLQDDQERELNAIIEREDERPLLYEFSGKVGREDAEHLSATTFEPISETRTPYSLGISIGTVLEGTLIGAGLKYESSHEAGSEAEVCVPTGTEGVLRCRTGPIGEPVSRESIVFNTQLRRFVNRRIGINPQVSYNATSSEWGAEVPIYFAPNQGGGLIGAVVPGYDSEADTWTLRLIVGATFGLGL